MTFPPETADIDRWNANEGGGSLPDPITTPVVIQLTENPDPSRAAFRIKLFDGQTVPPFEIVDKDDNTLLSFDVDGMLMVRELDTTGGFESHPDGTLDLAGWGEILPDGTTTFFGQTGFSDQQIKDVAEGTDPSDVATVSQLGGFPPDGWDINPGADGALTLANLLFSQTLQVGGDGSIFQVTNDGRLNIDGSHGADPAELLVWMSGPLDSTNDIIGLYAATAGLGYVTGWGLLRKGQEWLGANPYGPPDDAELMDAYTGRGKRSQWYEDTDGAPRLLFKEADINGVIFSGISAALTSDATAFRGISKPATPTDTASIIAALQTLGLVV